MLFIIEVTLTFYLNDNEVKLEVPISKQKSPILILKYLTFGLDWPFLGLIITLSFFSLL